MNDSQTVEHLREGSDFLLRKAVQQDKALTKLHEENEALREELVAAGRAYEKLKRDVETQLKAAGFEPVRRREFFEGFTEDPCSGGCGCVQPAAEGFEPVNSADPLNSFFERSHAVAGKAVTG